MKTIFVIFDSLNRRALSCYGGSCQTPNFARLAKKGLLFDNHYVGSLPCMPARRDMQTGRINFLHRSWGPLEPFDVSFPELLKEKGVYTHLITDHYHYFEDGGATYHGRYNTWEFVRGQEWDPWNSIINIPPETIAKYHHVQNSGSKRLQGIKNREAILNEKERPIAKCFEAAVNFIDLNRNADSCFLQLECFDPHEPFSVPERFRDLYPTSYDGPTLDWPLYQRVSETPEEVAEIQANYSALVTMCDWYLGSLLDYIESHEDLNDVAIVVTTDHGFMLGEHDWWAKSRMPFYNEVCHIPLLLYLPKSPVADKRRIKSLTQTIDLMPTFLELYDCEIPATVEGKSLIQLIENDLPIRSSALYGRFGAATNVTDGRYTYFRYPENIDNQDLWEYTLMPTHPHSRFDREEFVGASIETSFSFLRGFPVLKLPAGRSKVKGQGAKIEDATTVLFDLSSDPFQLNPIKNAKIERRMIDEMLTLMKANEAPPEAFARLNV